MLQGRTKKQKGLFCIAVLVELFIFYAFMYSDILITTSFGINFWDILFNGNIFNFYNTTRSDVDNAAYQIFNAPDYCFLIYVVFGIWNFPLWIAKSFLNIDVWSSILAICWAKTIILFFIFLVIKEILDICRSTEIGYVGTKHIILILLSSPILYMSAFVASQYDIIYLYFMLKAFRFYLEGNMWKFTGYMAITLPIKPLSVFLFVPLLLYKEKNIIRIAVKTVAFFAPWCLLNIIFPIGNNIDGNVDNILVMFRQKIVYMDMEIPLFVLVSVLLYIYCYIIKPKDEDKLFWIESVKIAFISYAVFFMTCPTMPYWYILILPFQCILIGLNSRYMYLNTIIETIISVFYTGVYIWIVPWCFGVNTLRSTYIGKIFGYRYDTTDNILEVMQEHVPKLYDMIEGMMKDYLFIVFIACSMMFIFVNYFKHSVLTFEDVETPKYLYVIRYMLCICVCMVPVVSYIF